MTSDLRISPATKDDYGAFVRLFAELGVPEPAPFDDLIFLASIVARRAGVIVGYAWWRPRGERLHVVYLITDPAHVRTGVGRALMRSIAETGKREGFREWLLNVKPENTPARRLYESFGMRASFESTSMELAWADVIKLPETSLRATELLATDEARFELAMHLAPREVTTARGILGRLAFCVQDDRGPAGLAVFDPSFPGAPIFRARDAHAARALLEAMSVHVRHASARLMVEDARLVEILTKIGASPVLQVLRMEGTIPP